MMENSKIHSPSLFKAFYDYDLKVQELVECRTNIKSDILKLHECTIQNEIEIMKNLHVPDEKVTDSLETSCNSIKKLLFEVEANDLNSITNNTRNNLAIKKSQIDNDIGLIKNVFNKLGKEKVNSK